ncbi:MAG: ribonuclease H-like domain-containing protein [Candidatus Doudnabacteria bacterium]|nr:ribonuclease H-like domain-containing protein [Candidatus Doudnabacteria bacterium]
MLKKIVLDLETQNLFQDVGGRGKNHLLKVSLCGIYDYSTDRYTMYEEAELPKLAPILQTADQIIGFNIKDFDFEVLQPYMNFNLSDIPYYDLLEEINKVLGHRIKLEAVAQATLGSGKSGDGKEAVLYYRNGRMDLLKKYCQDDVRITRLIYEYALKNQKIIYRDYFAVKEVALSVAEPVSREGVTHQAVLF